MDISLITYVKIIGDGSPIQYFYKKYIGSVRLLIISCFWGGDA